MTANVGTIDRLLRIIIGAILLGLPFMSGLAIFESTTVTAIAVIAGIVMLATSAMRFCPLYRIFGLRTCRT
ncbi:DUF2892 domain-containing protein [Loktanella sp. D2R18]|uniref:YgaP family membrane protein n=1 Tax=Rhodobacterales TaxID=204455 RepID=UPI000DE8BD79|nr:MULTISPECIES: DUF2892 domain-containing protein [Rhodobacterales]MDO6589918.1 DUF2892 domain-containing protein [Yoonia sp. 1_MG-2023]RBW45934.1 DUF2892 domain-containing protein [Loktanella sp. D2R18]